MGQGSRRWTTLTRASALAAGLAGLIAAGAAATTPEDVYATYGVHNDAHADDCANARCVYARGPHEPTDPLYPPYWTSHWTMYRVFNGYAEHPPPYDRKPPAPLKDGRDYQTSWGVTYYDATWRGPSGQGAMEERYDRFCLPIFPIPNNYSCAFISLGETAFFVTFEDRPAGMPPVCLFSPRNHPPERDFIKHLPYASGDGRRLGAKGIGYSFWLGADSKVMQVGARPDETARGGILFGYAFDRFRTPDRVDRSVPAYRHPQSFYFSGVPKLPQAPLPNAPIVSQNYLDFAMIKPDPRLTWAQVSELDPKALPACQLFDPPRAAPKAATGSPAAPRPTWATLGR